MSIPGVIYTSLLALLKYALKGKHGCRCSIVGKQRRKNLNDIASIAENDGPYRDSNKYWKATHRATKYITNIKFKKMIATILHIISGEGSKMRRRDAHSPWPMVSEIKRWQTARRHGDMSHCKHISVTQIRSYRSRAEWRSHQVIMNYPNKLSIKICYLGNISSLGSISQNALCSSFSM